MVRDGGLTCLSLCLSCSLSVWPGSRLHTCPVQRRRLRLGARRHPRTPHWHPCRYLPRPFAPVSPVCLTLSMLCVCAPEGNAERKAAAAPALSSIDLPQSPCDLLMDTHTAATDNTVCVRVSFPTFCHMLTEVKPLTNENAALLNHGANHVRDRPSEDTQGGGAYRPG